MRGAQTAFVLPSNFPLYPLRPDEILNLEHPAYPADEERRKEYLTSLKALMERVPSLLNAADNTTQQEAISSFHIFRMHTNLFRPDLKLIPELESFVKPFKAEKPLTADAPSTAAGSIYSFAMYSIHTKTLEQRIEVLGNQPLSTLRDSLFCVQHELLANNSNITQQNNPNEAGEKDEEQPLILLHQQAFFYLEEGFYIDTRFPDGGDSCSDTISGMQKWILKQQDFIYKQEAEAKEQRRKEEEEEKTKNQQSFEPGSFQAIAAAWQAAQIQKKGGKLLPVAPAKLKPPNNEAKGAQQAKRGDNGKSPAKRLKKPCVATDPDATSYSASKEDILALEIDASSMSSFTIQECNLVLGKSYLFCHAGHCEHLLILLDKRPYSSAIDGLPSLFPKELYCYTSGSVTGKKVKRRSCQVCEVSTATIATMHDRLAVSSPCYFCQTCYEMLHYGPDGELLYDDFVEIPYMHDTV